MARNTVRSGLIDARDRATKRRRDRRAVGPTPDDHERLDEWIETRLDEQTDEELERLDLTGFLRSTAHYDVTPEERLRQLAIALESRVYFRSRRRRWATIDRVYQQAIRLQPQDWVLHSSRSISASYLAESATDPRDVERLVRQSDESLRRALKLEPEDAELHYLAGHHTYVHRTGTTEDAMAEFRHAIDLDPSHGFARLYLAHGLHDLGRFEEAVLAYDKVPKAAFQGPISWRMDLLVEQRAQCRAKSGDLEGARADFERALARYEREPHLAYYTTPQYRHWAAEGPFPDLADRVEQLEFKARATDHL